MKNRCCAEEALKYFARAQRGKGFPPQKRTSIFQQSKNKRKKEGLGWLGILFVICLLCLYLGMTKAEIRKQAVLQRKGLSEVQVADYSGALLRHFTSFDLSAVKCIHLFLPIAERNEPDTFLFIDWLRAHHSGIRIIVPKADFDSALMTSYVYQGKDGLVKNLYNILEPEKGELHTGDVGLVLVPMLAFDLKGFRVGYGKGFYDRFLQGIETLKVGLSFFEPVEQIDDVNAHDVGLDCCITPEKIYRF